MPPLATSQPIWYPWNGPCWTGNNPPNQEMITLHPSILHHHPRQQASALTSVLTAHKTTKVSVYCNGSGFEGGIGAAAVLFINQEEQCVLKYHLGTKVQHMVYKAEIVGLILALHLLAALTHRLTAHIIIDSDSQATIKSLLNQCPHPAHYLLEHIHKTVKMLHENQYTLRYPRTRHPKTCGVINLQI